MRSLHVAAPILAMKVAVWGSALEATDGLVVGIGVRARDPLVSIVRVIHICYENKAYVATCSKVYSGPAAGASRRRAIACGVP